MRTRIAVLAAVVLIVGSMVWYLNKRSQRVEAPPVYTETIEKLDSGSISYEQKYGQILVRIGDSSGDSHVHVLDLGEMSEAEGLEMLKAKRKELAGKKATAESGTPALGHASSD